VSASFDVKGKVSVVTGGAGVLCAEMCRALAQAGAKVAVLDLRLESAEVLAVEIGNGAIGVACNVLEKTSVEEAAQRVIDEFGRVDILINGAGGNKPDATTSAEKPFFDLPAEAIRWVFDLNLMGTILPCQVFGKQMVTQKHGVILNISSMNAFRPLTRIAAYSAAKAAVSNFTQWLAVYMA
jgi:NAD(P)-dependent dehydrogenase (short-subunit alcohol dehydrogenase family)